MNYRGLKKIKFIYHGNWSDPELIYKKRSFNYYDIENLLYDEFKSYDPEDTTDQDFNKWILKNKNHCYNLINEVYFNE